MTQVEKTLGKTPDDLVAPEFPAPLLYVWEIYLELKSRPDPISYVDIKAYCDLLEEPLTKEDVRLIINIDKKHLAEYSL